MNTHSRAAAILLAASCALAACGSSSNSSSNTAKATTTTTAKAETTTTAKPSSETTTTAKPSSETTTTAKSSSGTTTTTKSSSATSTTSAVGAASTAAAVIDVGTTSLGKVLVDSKGMTLYLYKADKKGTTTSVCDSSCATAWPPETTTGTPQAGAGVTASMLGTITRSDGTKQVTYNGVPLYRHAADTKAGDTTGEKVESEWYVVSTSGAAV